MATPIVGPTPSLPLSTLSPRGPLERLPAVEPGRGSAEAGRLDLSGRDLRSLDVRSVDLRGADLRGADLTGANFTNAIMLESNFQGADLTDTNFSVSALQNSDFTRSIELDLLRGILEGLRAARPADITASDGAEEDALRDQAFNDELDNLAVELTERARAAGEAIFTRTNTAGVTDL